MLSCVAWLRSFFSSATAALCLNCMTEPWMSLPPYTAAPATKIRALRGLGHTYFGENSAPEILAQAGRADLLVWVASATQPARSPDRRCIRAARSWKRKDLGLDHWLHDRRFRREQLCELLVDRRPVAAREGYVVHVAEMQGVQYQFVRMRQPPVAVTVPQEDFGRHVRRADQHGADGAADAAALLADVQLASR